LIGCAAGLSLLASLVLAPGAARADESPPHLSESQHFTIDPVVDGVLIVGGTGFAEILSRILSTGEIEPVPPGNPNRLLSIDRVAVTQTIDPNAGTYSNYGLWAAYGYAVLDPILSGVRDGRSAALVDAIMYGETIALTQAFTDATKIAVRRPRPVDYAQCQNTTAGGCSNTDLQLSFFSGHASVTGAISATATYLAFVRQPHSARPLDHARRRPRAHQLRELRAGAGRAALSDRRHRGVDGWRLDRRARAPLPPAAPLPRQGIGVLSGLDWLSTGRLWWRRRHARRSSLMQENRQRVERGDVDS
jgi:PAP2 superfamily